MKTKPAIYRNAPILTLNILLFFNSNKRIVKTALKKANPAWQILLLKLKSLLNPIRLISGLILSEDDSLENWMLMRPMGDWKLWLTHTGEYCVQSPKGGYKYFNCIEEATVFISSSFYKEIDQNNRGLFSKK